MPLKAGQLKPLSANMISHPYREAWVPPVEKPKPKKTPQDIIDLADKAINHFNHSCPSGMAFVSNGNVSRNKGDFLAHNGQYYASPHGHRTTLSAYSPQGERYKTAADISINPVMQKFHVESGPCCLEERQALKDLETLSWYWKWRAKHRLGKKWVYYRMIKGDQELMDLLLPKYYVPKLYEDYLKEFKYHENFGSRGGSTGPR